MGLSDPDAVDRLQAYLSGTLSGDVQIGQVKKLSGGAIQENWAVDLRVDGGDWAGDHQWVLRKDAVSTVAASRSRAEEYQLLRAAEAVGARVPGPKHFCQDEKVLGQPFFLMERVAGTAAGHVLVKGGARPGLLTALGENLARIHSIGTDHPDLAFLGAPPERPARSCIGTYRDYLDGIRALRPAIEYGLAWLERNAPEVEEVTLCHRDYRTGNLMVDGDELSGILDWEFSGWSNPIEDIGWLCAKCWRAGAWHKEAGGLGRREDFYKAYEAQSGRRIDPDEVYYWEVMAHVRWATIGCQQAARHYSGEEISLELALTGYVVPELEYEILGMTGEG